MTVSRPRVWALPDGRIAVRAALPDCWLLVDGYGRMAIAHGELADDAVEMQPHPSLAKTVEPQWSPPLGPGEDDAEVWIPPASDCLERRPDKPCPHCSGLYYHHRTRRCADCGRRP